MDTARTVASFALHYCLHTVASLDSESGFAMPAPVYSEGTRRICQRGH